MAATIVASVACGDPKPAPQVKPNDHYVCVEGDTDVPPQEEIPGPFGDTGAIEGTGAADETGSLAWDEDEPSRIVVSPRSKPSDSRAPGFRSPVGCEP